LPALINLIPNTAVQFLDFGFNLNETRLSRAFLAEIGADGPGGADRPVPG
jgi:hypothetical protein